MQQLRILFHENETLRHLMLGILIVALIILIPTIIFSKENRLYNSLGLIIGTLISEGMAVHMAYSIEESFDMNEEQAAKHMKSQTIIRYVVVCALAAAVAIFRIGDPIFAIIGILTLKGGAYLAYPIGKFFHRNDPKGPFPEDEQ